MNAIELLNAAIQRLDRVNPQLNAISERCYDVARQMAQRPEARQGVLAGVPTLIKDLFSPVQGARMTQGSRVMGEARADLDCEVVARLRRAGCVFAGTTTSPEF